MSDFNAHTTARIVARVELGWPFNGAAEAAGVKVPTAKGWLARGRKAGSGEYAEFAQAVDEARAIAAERDPMDQDELARVVSSHARGGSVQAMKLRWAMLAAVPGDAAPADEDPLDELERRRRERLGRLEQSQPSDARQKWAAWDA
jgi:hypothetical protein